MILSPRDTTSSSASIIALINMPFNVPQSWSAIITSWATSTSRLVRYPESAVLRAVSAKPFLAP